MQETVANRARLLVVSAAVLWSMSGFMSKGIGLSGPTMAFYRALFAGLFLLPFLKRSKIKFDPAMIGLVLCFATMNLCFISAMTETTAANVIFLEYTSPIWMVLGGVFWLKEPFERKSLLTLFLGMAGIFVIVFGEWAGSPRGIALGLASGVTYAGVGLFLRKLRNYDPLWLTFINHLGGALFILPLILWTAPQSLVLDISSSQWAGLLIFGVIQTGFPYILFSIGLKGVSAQEAAVLTLIEPLLNPIVTFATVGEKPSALTLIGGALILSGIGLRYRPKFRLRKTKIRR